MDRLATRMATMAEVFLESDTLRHYELGARAALSCSTHSGKIAKSGPISPGISKPKLERHALKSHLLHRK
jgi:hypothetical protein